MEDYDLTREHERLAALETMRSVDPDNIEAIFKEIFGAESSGWTGWDEQYVTFIDSHRSHGLLYGTVGDGWHFLFAPSAGEGFWICARHGMTGKGFLRPESTAALTDVAVEKGLFHR